MDVGTATARIIAAVKCHSARMKLVQMRSSAILLECAWRGSKARDVRAAMRAIVYCPGTSICLRASLARAYCQRNAHGSLPHVLQ